MADSETAAISDAMLIAGLDLAAEPKGTALTILSADDGNLTVKSVSVGVTDDFVISETEKAVKLGIDCALGWPIAFTDFINRHSEKAGSVHQFDGDIELRRQLAYRATDHQVRELTGRWPLSVSTDRLGMAAIRCAGLVSKLAALGRDVSRDGSGHIAEVYPIGAMRIWQLDAAGYRHDSEKRAQLLQEISVRAPWLNFKNNGEILIESCDAFDSLVAALSAFAVATNQATSAPDSLSREAQIEGWVRLPSKSLSELL